MASGQARPLLRSLAGEMLERPPWWLMRQAGRYLPEYRALRAKASSFVEFCLDPALAAEATLQPVRRFGMDAAIVFADILLVPRALGQRVDFGDDGPLLAAIDEAAGLATLKARLTDLGASTFASSPEEFAGHIAAETEKWAKVIRVASIKPE